MEYKSKNHWKGLIQYHIIFVCKYRHKIFKNENLRNYTKHLFLDISNKYNFTIQTQEIDPNKPDHWHGLIITEPNLSPAQIIRVLKQESTINIWKNYSNYLKR